MVVSAATQDVGREPVLSATRLQPPARVWKSTISWVRCGVSFETAAARLPQDEGFLHAIEQIPHPEVAHGAISKDAARSCNPSFANSFTPRKTTSPRTPE